MRTRTFFFGASACLVLGAVAACVSDAPVAMDGGMDATKTPGTEGAPCVNNQCFDGLVCASNLCVRPPSDGGNGDGGTMMDGGGGGMDCGAPTPNAMVVACGANSCKVGTDACCMTTKNCIALDGGTCTSSSIWSCNQQAHCPMQNHVCCYRMGGTMGSCPIQVTQSPEARCIDRGSCEPQQSRILCASNADCVGSGVSTVCKALKDPAGNIVGICSP